MQSDSYRDDINIRHFKSRSQQPKVLAAAPVAESSLKTPNLNVFVVYDHSWDNDITQMDDMRFRYMGTSPHCRKINRTCSGMPSFRGSQA